MDELRLKNWYQDDQFKNQFEHQSVQHVVKKRWIVFENTILNWLQEHNKNSCRILDLGSGDGVNIQGLIEIQKVTNCQFEITAVDYNASRLEKLRERFGPSLQVCEFDILKHDISSLGQFDIVIFNHVLEHLQDDKLALAQVKRLMYEESVCILGVPNEGCLFASIRNHYLQPSILRTTDHVQFYTYKNLSQKIDQAGLGILHIFRNGFFYPHARIHAFFAKSPLGRWFSNKLKSYFPSQAAELMLVIKSDIYKST